MANKALFRPQSRMGASAGLLAALLAIIMTDNVKSAERVDLTPEEKSQLSDIGRFNTKQGKQGWQLRNRLVPDMSLAGIQLEGAQLENVEFERTDFTGASVKKSTFQDVEFLGATLNGATFEDAQFTGCKFVGVPANGANFKNCVLRACSGQNLAWRSNTLDGVHFERFTGKAVRFAGGKVASTQFLVSMLDDCDFTSTDLKQVRFEKCEMVTMGFSHVTSLGLTFLGGKIESSSFDEAVCTNSLFQDCTASGLTFKSCKGQVLQMTNCPSLERLGILDSEWNDVSITQCKSAPELLILNSQVNNLTLDDLELKHFELTESTVTGESVLRKCRIHDSDLSESKFEGLVMENTSFDGRVDVSGATFTGVRLTGVKYGSGLKLHNKGLISTKSDKFGP